LSSYHIVLAASQEAQTLKVCTSPRMGFVDRSVVAKLATVKDGTGFSAVLGALLLWPDVTVEATPSEIDPDDFIYMLTPAEGSTILASPCRGFRYRDECSHINAAPLDTIKFEA